MASIPSSERLRVRKELKFENIHSGEVLHPQVRDGGAARCCSDISDFRHCGVVLSATLVYCDETFTLFLSLVCVLLFNINTRPLSISAVTMSLDPTIVHSDFEVATQNAIGAVFPSARLLGCWFHHNQAVFRTIQKRGLQGEFNKSGSVFKLLARGFFFSFLFASRQD